MRNISVLVSFLITVSVQAQLLRPTSHSLEADSVYSGLLGSSISDIEGQGDTLWFGSGHGLSATHDNGDSFISFSRRYSNLGQGGVSALAVHGDSIWLAMGYDTSTAFGNLKAGGGISRSVDGGLTWTHLQQPMDSLESSVIDGETVYEKYSEMEIFGDTLLTVDVVTPVQNITYDLDFDGTRLWATSFGGGLRVSHDLGDSWEQVMLPWDSFDRLDSLLISDLKSEIDENPEFYALDPLIHFNHIAFAVEAWNDTIWVGTSHGINRSLDGGHSWDHYTFQNSNISGNWVIALDRQIMGNGDERIWASTITTGAGDVTGFSFFDTGSEYWRAPFLDYRIWNIASDANNVYAATDQGLWKSKDGLHFSLLPSFRHADNSEIVYSDAVYAVNVNTDGGLWIGTGDGLVVSYNDGLTWNIHKARIPDEEGQFYAYPNPFTPRYDKVLNNEGHLIIRFTANAGVTVSVTVFDFAMHRVKQVWDDVETTLSGPQGCTWSGRNEEGYLVANGTYFIRLEIGSNIEWTKVMVIN